MIYLALVNEVDTVIQNLSFVKYLRLLKRHLNNYNFILICSRRLKLSSGISLYKTFRPI